MSWWLGAGSQWWCSEHCSTSKSRSSAMSDSSWLPHFSWPVASGSATQDRLTWHRCQCCKVQACPHMNCCSCISVGGTIWERITRHKLPVVEPGESALFPQAAEDFKTKLADPTASGAVFFAVCRCELAVQHGPALTGASAQCSCRLPAVDCHSLSMTGSTCDQCLHCLWSSQGDHMSPPCARPGADRNDLAAAAVQCPLQGQGERGARLLGPGWPGCSHHRHPVRNV